MNVDSIHNSPIDPAYSKFVDSLPKQSDHNTLKSLWPVIQEAVKSTVATDDEPLTNITKETRGDRAYKIHGFKHPDGKTINIYIFLTKPKELDGGEQADSLPSSSSSSGGSPNSLHLLEVPSVGSLATHTPLSRSSDSPLPSIATPSSTRVAASSSKLDLASLLNSTDVLLQEVFTEVLASNKIFHTCYQVKFHNETCVSVKPKARLSIRFSDEDHNNQDLHQAKVEEFRHEIEIFKRYRDCPDICHLEDGAIYVGNHHYNADSEQGDIRVVDFLKGVMYLDLYPSDLHAWYNKTFKGLPKRERLVHAAPILYTLLRSLKTVHASGVVHRDIKADNILLAPMASKGHETLYRSVLTDFGSSRETNIQDLPRLSYVFQAPEEGFYASQGNANPATKDIWNAGYLFFLLVNNRLPDWIYLSEVIIHVNFALDRLKSVETQTSTQKQVKSIDWTAKSNSLNECTALLTSLRESDLVRFDFPQVGGGNTSATLLSKGVLPKIKSLSDTLTTKHSPLSEETKKALKSNLEKLQSQLYQKETLLWQALQNTNLNSQSPNTFEEMLRLLAWRMLRPRPEERITLDDAFQMMTHFCSETGLLREEHYPPQEATVRGSPQRGGLLPLSRKPSPLPGVHTN